MTNKEDSKRRMMMLMMMNRLEMVVSRSINGFFEV